MGQGFWGEPVRGWAYGEGSGETRDREKGGLDGAEVRGQSQGQGAGGIRWVGGSVGAVRGQGVVG